MSGQRIRLPPEQPSQLASARSVFCHAYRWSTAVRQQKFPVRLRKNLQDGLPSREVSGSSRAAWTGQPDGPKPRDKCRFWRSMSNVREQWTPAVGRTVRPVGKPDAGNQHVRFDEWGTGNGARLFTATDSTQHQSDCCLAEGRQPPLIFGAFAPRGPWPSQAR